MPLTVIDPAPALVVVDLQKGILTDATLRPHAVQDVVARAAALAAAFRGKGWPVALVVAAGVAPGRTDRGTAPFTPPPGFTDLADALDLQPSDHLATKHRRSAFAGTDLDAHLRHAGVTQVVLCGVSTSAGVESSARAAHDLGYHVVLAVDAMSDRDADAHRHSVETIFPRLSETATTDEILGMMGP